MINITLGSAIPLTKIGVKSVVDFLGVEEAIVWAVIFNESICGYLPSKRPAILFERHKFHGMTHGDFDKTDPSVSLATPGGYGSPGEHQYERLAAAVALDETAALKSTSWGLTQIMGYYAEKLGYMNVQAMVRAFAESEDNHLYAFSQFCYLNKLTDSLIHKDFAGFSAGYNGKNYKINKYDERLKSNYERFSKRLPDIDVRAKQVICYYNNLLRLHDIDGIDGPETQRAISSLAAPSA